MNIAILPISRLTKVSEKYFKSTSDLYPIFPTVLTEYKQEIMIMGRRDIVLRKHHVIPLLQKIFTEAGFPKNPMMEPFQTYMYIYVIYL